MGIVVVDTYRDVVYINDQARELGLVRDRLLDDRAWAAAQRTLATGEDVDVDLSPAQARNPLVGPAMSVRGHVRLLTEDDRRFAVVYVDDQSEHARMEATRRDFVANVSHELKTPVGAMGVLAEALLASTDDPGHRRAGSPRRWSPSPIGWPRWSANSSSCPGCRARSRCPTWTPSTSTPWWPKRCRATRWPPTTPTSTSPPTRRRGYRVLGDQPLLVTAHRQPGLQRHRVLADGSSVSISRRRRGDNIEIAVTDRGIGIARADQERVFERFFRVDKARSRATGGTGLGLAIVKHVAANHNGSIRLWSQPGTGSTFTLSIPAYPVHDDDPDSRRTREPAAPMTRV